MKRVTSEIKLNYNDFDYYERLKFLSINNNPELEKDQKWLNKLLGKSSKKTPKNILTRKIDISKSRKLDECKEIKSMFKDFRELSRKVNDVGEFWMKDYDFLSDDENWFIKDIKK
ncbi:hypothetical protein [Mycoplasmopsis edwardii]|uniref:hypothetical protein n=1 Tax=Mycoplasmopsis edwardii TaxID=53558 RepID=UPI000E3ED575|nr:hypothetical protein [Mycoplasmopsis edwardii]